MQNKNKLLIIRIILSVLLIMTLVLKRNDTCLKRAHFISDNVNTIIIILIAVVIIFGPYRFIRK
ncbi:hypothetical protein L323_08995 [Ruminiclostridium papyrosolvens C7]|uniref:Uncharacterized protein n=1 Tax=Ruminiclostridium papyrosolvens C7 TaxID=1330534 RepID=U4R312_9FIRM|nr:hypothetical protein L323_08995 [Ruminiclostridium papyrosolvens C7]